MARKSNKTLYEFKVNVWQHDNNQISMKVINPFDGKKEHLSSVESTDRHHGNNRARTHNDLFKFFKSVLQLEGLWKDVESRLGRKTKISKNESIDFENRYGFIYITTNLVNGMKYIGKHSRNSGSYIGSGTELKAAIEEFGTENFEREEIAYAYTADQLNKLEKMYIDTFNAVNDPNFYNMCPGGNGWYEKELIK